MATWFSLISDKMATNGDSFDNVVHLICGEKEEYIDGEFRKVQGFIYDQFNDGYGSENGCPFQLWTKDYVYFPIKYDGAEWVGSAHRNPVDIPLDHQGG